MLFIVALTGKIIQMEIDVGLTIDMLKLRIFVTEGIPPHQQKLWHRDQWLENGRTISDYNIQSDHCVFIM
jgi:hypothetical protein